MIGILDYGLGNLASVGAAIEHLGFPGCLISHGGGLDAAEKLIIPGVGAFGDAMQKLGDRDLIEPLHHFALEKRRPVLGICLGFQLMAREGTEFGTHAGLGWIEGTVHRLSPEGHLRIPHVGWNDLFQRGESILFRDVPDDALFYYTHSFHLRCDDPAIVKGTCDYGGEFTAAVERDNICGLQCHAEKSQQWGLQVLKNFLELK